MEIIPIKSPRGGVERVRSIQNWDKTDLYV
jgi:hypothetical protein